MGLLAKTLLRGERVYIGAFETGDAAIIARWSRDAEYLRRLGSAPTRPESEADISKLIEEWRADKTGYNFTIRRIADDVIIGTVGLFGILWNHRTAWIGIGIGEPAYQGKGYGREAMALVIDYGFAELNLHRIQLNVYSYNTPAIRVYEALGFQREATLRQSVQRDGNVYDTYLYGLLRHEWGG